MSNVKKLNTLVENVFSEYVENLNELWTSNQEVQKQVKSFFSAKNTVADRKKKDPLAPKRGKSAYLFFCADFRDTVKKDLGADSKATDVTKELGARWNTLKESKSKNDKQKLSKYEKMAEEDKSRYEAEKAEYVPPEGDEKPNRRGGKKNVEKTGPKRAKSAYLFFCDAHRNTIKSEHPEMKATEITGELGRRWNDLKEDSSRKDEFSEYEKLAAEDKQRYETEKSSMASGEDTEVKKAPVKGKTTKEKTSTEKAAVKGKTTKEKAPVKGKKAKEPEPEPDELVEESEVVDEEENKPKKGKGSKSGEGEKSNAYQSFSNSRRPELKEQFPKMKAGEITKKLGAEWKAMSKEEQDTWKNVPVAN